MEAAGDRTFGLRRNVGGFKSALINLRKSLPPNAWCGGPRRGLLVAPLFRAADGQQTSWADLRIMRERSARARKCL